MFLQLIDVVPQVVEKLRVLFFALFFDSVGHDDNDRADEVDLALDKVDVDEVQDFAHRGQDSGEYTGNCFDLHIAFDIDRSLPEFADGTKHRVQTRLQHL